MADFFVSLQAKTKTMAEQEEKNEKKKLKLNKKYVFMMSHDETMEPIINFKVNLMKLSIITLSVILVLMVLTAVVIAYTPLREYIPGYADQTSMEREVYALNRRADSIEREMERKDIYFNNLKMIIEGYPFENDSLEQRDIYAPLLGFSLDTVDLGPSQIDSAFRAEFEEENLYNLNNLSPVVRVPQYNGAANFFAPITGSIAKAYDPSEGHFGIDIVSTENQVIKATLDGTVVFASWTLDFGYTLGIQHEGNYFSCYKHNATLLKKEGDFVKAGEAIAILGASGELSEGPMLHFELWHNGLPQNPSDYINFEKGSDN
ncbi:MAG: M23 family metallopeptidase [Bacteroidales bacterium]|nr:M23 family metallopeptidase [Bacteroidales bacterium]